MKIKLTAKILISMILVFQITFLIYGLLNLLIYKTDISFGEKIYSVSFSTSDFIEPFIEELEDRNDFRLNDEYIKRLKENNVWIQVLDKGNNEVFKENKPDNIPTSYATSELINFIQNPWESIAPTTVSTKELIKGNEKYTLLVGFPINKVFKYSLTFTEESFRYHLSMIVFGFVLVGIVAYIFSRNLVKPMVSVIKDIEDLKDGIYKPKKSKRGIYEEVSKNINNLSVILKENEMHRKEVDEAKEEWIANISHDLKTPLSSIKGYAELLQGEEYDINLDDAKRYTLIILANTNHIQELVNDLSLIYKLKNKVIPISFSYENLVTILQECIIDLLNNSNYSEREVNFNFDDENIIINCDKKYINRAITNLLVNALDHNTEDTVIDVSVFKKDSFINIIIEDNGQGIGEADLKNIFNRYYRGVNSSSKSKGSGLGMAISKEIINWHKGDIKVQSEIGKGTKIEIFFEEIKENHVK